MMNKLLSLLLVLALSLTLVACNAAPASSQSDAPAASTGKYTPGTYEGTAKGYGGDLKVTVTLGDNQIEKIEVAENKETAGVGTVAIEKLPAAIIANQSLAVDAVAGATVTSKGLLEAITAALVSAGVDTNTLQTPVEKPAVAKKTETVEADVIVIGAGGAGMAAALEAKAAGKNVVVIEKMAMAGGNTIKATGGMNAVETSVQKTLNVEDSVQSFIDDTMKGGHNVNDLELVTALAERSAGAIDWLDSIGAPLPDLTTLGGSSHKRAHRPEGGAAVGSYLVEKLVANMEKNDISVYYNTKATELVLTDGAVTGVKAEGEEADYLFAGKAIVIATGGFGANEEIYTKYKAELKGFVTTNAPGATGDGIVMAEAVGAQLVDIDQIQIHPTVHQATSIMITEGLRGDGAILVNQSGERFINELETRDVVSAAEIAQEGGYAYLIFDQALCDRVKAAAGYVTKELTVQGDTIEALANEIKVTPETLSATLESWNKAVADQKDEAFGRTTGMEYNISKGPFYAIQIAPGVHHTMGGLKIDVDAEVIGATGEPIPGLFAAGEVTGGIHGGNRLGGNAVADIVVFGRQAGQSAADYCDK
ncbi:flavocytochrome c [Oscillospiraceae bacterium LTW-04]|nr:flavocytochrome c [Oscillospiraceae bacterium MB24-C1]